MTAHVTQQDIEAGLRQLGLGRGAAVEVHSSLSSLGSVEGGAAAVVNALMNRDALRSDPWGLFGVAPSPGAAQD